MPYAPGGGGSIFIVNPTKVHAVGQQVSGDATDQMYNVSGSAFDLDNQFDKVMPQMPSIVQDALTTFQQNYHSAYYDLLNKRLAIGDLLQDTGTQAEQNEIETTQLFQSNLEPQTLKVP